MSSIQCKFHPGTTAAAVCATCQASLCTLCSTFDGFDRCAACHVLFVKRRRLRRGVLASILVVVVGGVGFKVFRHIKGTLSSAGNAEANFDYGKHAKAIDLFRQGLAKEPCDRSLIVQYGEKLLQAGDKRGAISVVDGFIQKCGAYPRLLWVKFSALKNLSEFKAAGEVAGELIEDDPNDHDFWWWRADVMEQAGNLEQAASDYREALAASPRLRNIPLNLAGVYEKLNMPCEALVTLENYQSYYPELMSNSRFNARVEKLRRDPKCSGPIAPGSATVRLDPLHSSYEALVSINGVEGRFVIDTGASAVVVKDTFARRAQLPTGGQKVKVKTANGLTTMRVTTANHIRLQDTHASTVPILVGNSLSDDIDGLLGMSFLSRFDVQLDGAGKKMTIRTRAR